MTRVSIDLTSLYILVELIFNLLRTQPHYRVSASMIWVPTSIIYEERQKDNNGKCVGYGVGGGGNYGTSGHVHYDEGCVTAIKMSVIKMAMKMRNRSPFTTAVVIVRTAATMTVIVVS